VAGGDPAFGASSSRAEPSSSGAEGAAQPGEPPFGMDWPDPKFKILLFDPRPMLKWLAPALKPLWRVLYLTPLLLYMALYVGLYREFDLIVEDLTAILDNKFSLLTHLIFAWLTVHLVSSIAVAVVATNYKVPVEKVGLCLIFGFMPRWCLEMNGANLMTRRQLMWTHAAPLFARLVLLSLGILVWYKARGVHETLSQSCLLIVFLCTVGLLLQAGNPLLKAHAYYILCAYLNEPHLRGKAFLSIWNKLRGNVYQHYDRKALTVYGLCTMLWIFVTTLVIAHLLATYLIGDLRLNGSGIVIVCGFVAWMTWLTFRGLKKFGEEFDRKLQFDRWRARALPVSDIVEGEVKSKRIKHWKMALAICLLLSLFLPYRYESAGEFVVFPVLRNDLTTDTPGVIREVFFDGGEFVKKGTVLARLADDNYLAAYNTVTAQLEEQRQVIANLKGLPKAEAVQLAAAQLKIARMREPYSRAKVNRLRPLAQAGAVTQEEFEASLKEHVLDLEQVAEKEANLKLVKAGPTAEEISAAEAKLAALVADRDGVQAKLDRTYIRMPFDGNILTLHLKNRVNSYLEIGKPFAAVESTGYVNAQVQIREADLQFVRIGMEARARATSHFFDEFKGRVVQIDRNVTSSRAGSWINVIVRFENEDGRLHTGATGEAKIGPVTLPVWQAFTLSLEHFILVDLWSWLP
jgi:putative peptide zinc metalloprotease protein